MLLSIILVWWRLEDPALSKTTEAQSGVAKWKRIDFVGAFFLSFAILPVLLAVDLGGRKIAWGSPIMVGIFGCAIVSGVLFCLTEKYWAREPVFPLRLLGHYVVVTSYLQLAIQTSIQIAVGISFSMRARNSD